MLLYELRNLCIENNYFTYGCNFQYDKMFKMAETEASVHDIAVAIWICTEDASLEDIEEKIKLIVKNGALE